MGRIHRAVHASLALNLLTFRSTFVYTIALSAVVGRAVFGPGQITIHRLQGAILIHLNVALIFTRLYQVLMLTVRAEQAQCAREHPRWPIAVAELARKRIGDS